MNRFFVDQIQIGNENIEIWDQGDIKHISKVLRLKIGDKIEISDGTLFEYVGEISSIDGEKIVAKITDKQAFRGEPATKVTLFQCLPKQGKMEVIIQKSVELGIFSIVPVFSSRSLVKAKKDIKKDIEKTERWNKISKEAVKQCKRGIIPKIEESINFKEMLDKLRVFDLILFPYENEKDLTMKDMLKANKDAKNIALIIGPEGGFSDEEAEEILKLGGKSLSLGRTTLRTETAGPAALAMIMYEFEL